MSAYVEFMPSNRTDSSVRVIGMGDCGLGEAPAKDKTVRNLVLGLAGGATAYLLLRRFWEYRR